MTPFVIPGHKCVKKCTFIAYPRHPQQSRRKACNTPLTKEVISCGKTFLYPRQIYCYYPLKKSLQLLVNEPNFFSLCDHWKSRKVPNNVFPDIYDGLVWQSFINFLSSNSSCNLLFGLNVDWFQPFTHCAYSVGAIYLCIHNLPRHIRFNEKYIILCGIIPGPKEPSETINSFLDVLVDELMEFWSGVTMMNDKGERITVRAALSLVTCDIPALRKCLAFAGIRANKACSKCSKSFPTSKFGDKADYSGFDMSMWFPRSAASYKQDSLRYHNAKMKSQQKEVLHETGVRYCVLSKLPYFDVVHYHVIDPMHNLLLGTSKTMLELWKKMDLLQEKHFYEIQEWCDSFHVPPDVGRIPGK